jgi:hypothetical protein
MAVISLFSWQDEPWAKFSTLEVAACHAMHFLHSIAIWPNLELKTRSKQLLGYLPLDIVLPGLIVQAPGESECQIKKFDNIVTRGRSPLEGSTRTSHWKN